MLPLTAAIIQLVFQTPTGDENFITSSEKHTLEDLGRCSPRPPARPPVRRSRIFPATLSQQRAPAHATGLFNPDKVNKLLVREREDGSLDRKRPLGADAALSTGDDDDDAVVPQQPSKRRGWSGVWRLSGAGPKRGAAPREKGSTRTGKEKK